MDDASVVRINGCLELIIGYDNIGAVVTNVLRVSTASCASLFHLNLFMSFLVKSNIGFEILAKFLIYMLSVVVNNA